MDNLSGGEKTVAALALLFSMRRFVSWESFLFSLNIAGRNDLQIFSRGEVHASCETETRL
jgi:hypothetical protein